MSVTRISLSKKWDGSIDPNSGYQYALVYMISELRLIPFSRWSSVDLDECMEARAFGKHSELHLFREDDEWKAVSIRDIQNTVNGKPQIPAFDPNPASPNEPFIVESKFATIDRVHPIRQNCKKEVPDCTEMIIREYISYDEDGQAVTARTRLVGLQ